ncbi:anti-sigma factor family protein [Priestia koreensis]|uniref:Anti-sigma-W factor RsiW n=1 Tax=Priestia koreensis TaxID=284581 RepID=A0A0M0KNG4_9BACI|nr:anti-sigma factor [Priestia koreensis]KOO40396.1 anti-sigma factor [Priestia koreensis]MCM3006723.1 anti-sigma factor [Priestia koreensis]UNL85177.1 anti-sigma factor [Priestia koreensis]
MKNCSGNYTEMMHDYLDGDITKENEQILREHLKSCEECQLHMKELKRTIAFVQSASHVAAPSDFTLNVMNSLPKQTQKAKVNKWFRSHPLLTASSLFVMLMVGSLFSTWKNDHDFSVSKQPNLVINGQTVTVPKGETIKGNVIVRNGDIKIEGKVDGDVTVVNGHRYMASAGEVTGKITVLDELFEWVWYNLKSNVHSAVKLVESK